MSKTHDWLGLNNGNYGTVAGEFSEVVIEYLIARYTEHGDTAIDCGAADGRMLRPMLKAVGDKGTVVAFEPIPHVFDKLQESFSRQNAVLLQMCVSDSIGDEVKFRDDSRFGDFVNSIENILIKSRDSISLAQKKKRLLRLFGF
jgi:hypothetical protein